MKMVETVATPVRLDFRRLLVLNNAHALLVDTVLGITVISASTDSIKTNLTKVHARLVMLGVIFPTTAVLRTNTMHKVTVSHVLMDGNLQPRVVRVLRANKENMLLLQYKAVKHVKMDSIQIR